MPTPNELEQVLDQKLNSLDIFQIPLELALIYLLRVFEDRSRIPTLAAVSRGRDPNRAIETAHHLAREAMGALSVLLPILYQRNQPWTSFVVPAYLEAEYSRAGNAVEFANIYRELKDVINLSRIGVYRIVNRKDKTFFVPTRENIEYDARAQIINAQTVLADPDFNSIYTPDISLISLIQPYLNRGINNLISRKRNGAFTFRIPQRIDWELQQMFQSLLQTRWTLDDQIQIGSYKVGDAKKLWVSLTKICTFHSVVTMFSGLPGIGMEYLPVIMEKHDLVLFLSRDTGIPYASASNFVSDLTFNQTIQTNEVMFQPLIQSVNFRMLFFSSHMILFSNPERNLMKLWARRYPGAYGAKIANKGNMEERKLEQDLKRVNSIFIGVSSKKIGRSGKTVTDIDVALYDTIHKEVLFIQMKWCIQPDSTVEVRGVDSKLNEGMEQLDKVSDYIENEPNAYQNIFGRSVETPNKVFMCVVSTSSIGSFWVDKKYPVFNRDVVLKSIKDKSFKSITELMKDLHKSHCFRSHIDFSHVFQIQSFNKRNYFIPATRILNSKNFIQRLYRNTFHLFFRVLLRDHYITWRSFKALTIFMNRDL